MLVGFIRDSQNTFTLLQLRSVRSSGEGRGEVGELAGDPVQGEGEAAGRNAVVRLVTSRLG